MITKYRAWDSSRGLMFQVQRIVWDSNGNTITAFGKHEDGTDALCFEQENLMLFTGLLDKNKKEIYVGDIFNKGIITFFYGKLGGSYTTKTTCKKGWEYSDDWEEDMSPYVEREEILGNIHENENLLIEEYDN